jgi:hypothetical protein
MDVRSCHTESVISGYPRAVGLELARRLPTDSRRGMIQKGAQLLSRVIFDTSGINALRDGGAASKPLMRGLACGFHVILTGLSAGEIVATSDAGEREALLSQLDWLLTLGTYIPYPNDIIRLLISVYSSDPSRFDWMKVSVRAQTYETAIPRRAHMDDKLSIEVKHQQREMERGFGKFWKGLRPLLDEILEKEPSKRPNNYEQAIQIAVREGGVLEALGQTLYRYVAEREPSGAEVRSFMDACPPFRAACYALVMAWYNWSLPEHGGSKGKMKRAGRNDLMSAVYLPYCDRFISADAPQIENLRDIASAAQIDCKILSFDEFDRAFALVG